MSGSPSDRAAETLRGGSDPQLPDRSAAAAPASSGLSDRYTVVEELGAGANGRVIAARDRILDRVVAIKMLIEGDSLETARFIREARITASLEHPNIVPLHDLEFPAVGNINFIMRRVVGITLGEAIVRAQAGQVPPEIATTNDLLTLILKVCDALARAHARGVIHQDVKPDNIMLGEHGEVVLVDWGEARLSGDSTVGKPSQVVGTPIYMSPEQAQGERADERSDVYCLGASLFHALLLRYPTWDDEPERFWQKKREGLIDPPSVAEQRRVPRRLLAIMLKALAADPQARYQSIQALSDDLTAFQAGQAVQAYRENPFEFIGRWVSRHRATLATAAVILLTLCSMLWWQWGEQLKERASWGTPIAVEDFRDGTWQDRWIQETPGMFAAADGQLVSTAPKAARIAFRQRLAAPVAIEYDGQILPDSIPCDLSVIWNEGPAPFSGPGEVSKVHGYLIQAGAFTNHFCAIYRLDNNERLAQTPFKLNSGQTYHLRVEIDETHICMWLDGRLLVEHTDIFPATSGFLTLYGYYPGKAFSNLRIWKKGVAEKVSVLAIGDAAFQAGAWDLAAAQYQRVADSKSGDAISDQARYRQGLSELQAGRPEAANAVWKLIPPGPDRDRVLCHDLDVLNTAGRHAEVAARMIDLYLRAPWVRGQLRSQWMRYLIELKDDSARSATTQTYLAVRNQAFPDDPATAYSHGLALIYTNRYAEALARFPNEPVIACASFAHLGRDQGIVDGFSDMPGDLGGALLRLGLYERATELPAMEVGSIVMAYIKSGRIADGLVQFPDHADLLIADGQAGLILQQPQKYKDAQITALLALGRWQQAAEAGDLLAQQLLGREPQATPPAGTIPLPAELRLLVASIAGNRTVAADSLTEVLASTPDYAVQSRWFGRQVMTPFLAALSGNLAPWRTLLATGSATPPGAADLRRVYGQRLWFAAALLRGEIDDAHFLAQPTTSEAPALLLVLRGMEADLRGDYPLAATRYRAFKALPGHARLLDDMRPNLAIERFVAWRLGVCQR